MEIKYLLTQAKRKNGNFEKGCVVHNSENDARQGFHAYLSAYGFGRESGTDYVFACVHDTNGAVVEKPTTWDGTIVRDVGE